MSIGISLVMDLVRRSCFGLGKEFHLEIIERHHRAKADAPSGTALMLAEAAKSALKYDADYIYDRHNVRKPRADNELGVSSVRGGTIAGEHVIVFAGPDEVIEIKHTVYSRNVLAAGAIRAAKFTATVKNPGIYSMQDLLNNGSMDTPD